MARHQFGCELDKMAARIVADVAEAIHYSHRQVSVHGDLKPNYKLIARQRPAQGTDFGIALEHSELGRGTRYVGTPLYRSPE
jgi:eukaryotic-like serine/threonine-protein kinase